MVVSQLNSEPIESKSDAKAARKAEDTFDPHTTKWSDVNLPKFRTLIAVSTTFESAIFYPYVVV